jgi:hypothetical protein
MLARFAASAGDFFGLPANRVVELGSGEDEAGDEQHGHHAEQHPALASRHPCARCVGPERRS